MKFLIITSVKEHEKDVLNLFKKAKITAFSDVDINGFKTNSAENLIDNWFSNSTDKIRSTLFFTFTEKEKIAVLLEAFKQFNQQKNLINPLRAIVLDVAQFI
ncbi:MAG: hypothetical protein COS42_02745 [Flavobacteriales bacterium CG03_land_8_20_14_0_80_35_15]|nr:hypothetical protein [Zetaproteobacteria bacterium]NDK17967.1 hypothetical protein [Flavobacteriales bacterium]OIO10149.1 MAG: hypothetical protein AUJ53_07525 [Flavobacteriaceae bacterium CG1_02_35_72]PIR14364.1 MAG: hypothetical protein COV50_03135 [Flavobacteriales bacterium CG11_big_fil_rev_8_21_14_0_20_35_7]PIV18039.1 MAG: hypothetical protein COS42_02745 [Flavobacteriales bacterium CG03_land_8_20_14_0_80_35_15]PIX06540.1 MAG: hypothetical protein COZ76_08260 [Flavobacteriales bacteriu